MNIGLNASNAGVMGNNTSANRRRALVLNVAGWMLAAMPAAMLAGCGAARPMQYYQLTVPNDMAQAEPNPSGISSPWPRSTFRPDPSG